MRQLQTCTFAFKEIWAELFPILFNTWNWTKPDEVKENLNIESYWTEVLQRYSKIAVLGKITIFIILLFILSAIYAPFLASSKPLAIRYDGDWYFPLFRYFFYQGFYTKYLDLFFNLLIFTFPIALLSVFLLQGHKRLQCLASIAAASIQILLLHCKTQKPSDHFLG